MDYKNTLLLPFTNFSMKANLNVNEPKFQKYWLDNKIYENKLKQNSGNVKYVFLDGPPYANGNIHIGHALNKILKDFNIRFQNSQGKQAPFIMGWDTHGLPIENAIEKQGFDKKAFSRIDFTKKCYEYACEQIENQKKQFQTLGLFNNYKDTYYTFNKDYEYCQLKYFYEMLANNFIYQNFKPIYWSWSSESALAEAEIEYLEKKSTSIYLKLPIIKNDLMPDATSIVIWTTTPWTIAGNKAAAINKQFEYILIKANEEHFIIAKELLADFINKNNLKEHQVISSINYSDLIKLKYRHPIFDKQVCPIIHSNHVTLENGTGIVHIAPAHGLDDFYLGQKYKLEILPIIDSKGILINWGDFNNQFYLKAEPLIVNFLVEKKLLISHSEFKHQYPHDWRTKKPIIYLATLQWFISIKNNKNIILKNTKNLVTLPQWGKDRLVSMIKNREDWCISRQRYWGAPIAVFFDENSQPVIKKDIFNHVLKLVKKHGSFIWYKYSNKELLPVKYHKYADKWTKELDIMDVWFDSGTAFSQLDRIFPNSKNIQADLFLEGNDQFRGWFNSSLIISSIVNARSPYKKLLTHGFVLDKNGNKMSKSKGNVIDPLVILKQYGADILRLWVSSINFIEDVRISEDNLKQVAENYRKIRNTIKFILGNLNDYNHLKDQSTNLTDVDKLIISELAIIYKDNLDNYANFKYDRVLTSLLNFIVNKLSGFYLDFAKDVLYIKEKNNLRRRQIQTTLYYILEMLLHGFGPIMPHTIEEAYHAIPNKKLLRSFILEPKLNVNKWVKLNNLEWNKFWNLQKDALKTLEISRNDKVIGKSLEAEIIINLKPEFKIFEKWNLQELFMVSHLVLDNKLTNPELEYNSSFIKVNSYAENPRCVRCWKHFDITNMHNEEICKSCHEVLKK